MKQVFLLGLLMLCVMGCNDFSHLHYRKLKKVPAQPELKPLVSKPKEHRFLAPADSSFPKEEKAIIPAPQSENVAPPQKTIREARHKRMLPPAPAKKEKAVFSKSKKVKALSKSVRPGMGRVVLLILLLLFLLGLFVAGIWILINGIIFASFWLIVLGLLMIFLFIVPVLGGFMAMGDRTPSEGKQFE